jgi:hypothetical protein
MTKNSMILSFLFLALINISNGQFEKGNKVINIGLGSNSYYYGIKIGSGLPVVGAFEYGFGKHFSAGCWN